MALSLPSLATPMFTGSSALTSASFPPSASALLIVLATSRSSTGIPGVITISSAPSFGWTSLASTLYDDGADNRIRVASWAFTVGASPASMTVTLTSTSSGRVTGGVVQLTGSGGTPANHASGISNTGDPSTTLGSAPAANSTLIGWYAAQGSNAISPPAGFTELGENITSSLATEIAYDATSAATTNAWSTTNGNSAALVIEVSEASGAGMVVRRQSSRFRHLIVR